MLQLAQRELTRFFSSADFLTVIGNERLDVREQLERRIQIALDECQPALGVKLEFVGLMGVHPPVEIAESYQRAVAAEEIALERFYEAKSYEAKLTNKSKGNSKKIVIDADAYRYRQAAISKASSQRFQKQEIAYQNAPAIFKLRSFLDLLEYDLGPTKKYVIAGSAREVFILDLQEKLRPDLLDDLEIDGDKKYGSKRLLTTRG